MNLPIIQAKISACKTKKEAWDLIQAQPKESHQRLIGHAETVFTMRQKKTT